MNWLQDTLLFPSLQSACSTSLSLRAGYKKQQQTGGWIWCKTNPAHNSHCSDSYPFISQQESAALKTRGESAQWQQNWYNQSSNTRATKTTSSISSPVYKHINIDWTELRLCPILHNNCIQYKLYTNIYSVLKSALCQTESDTICEPLTLKCNCQKSSKDLFLTFCLSCLTAMMQGKHNTLQTTSRQCGTEQKQQTLTLLKWMDRNTPGLLHQEL